jgi:hypothetical protein
MKETWTFKHLTICPRAVKNAALIQVWGGPELWFGKKIPRATSVQDSNRSSEMRINLKPAPCVNTTPWWCMGGVQVKLATRLDQCQLHVPTSLLLGNTHCRLVWPKLNWTWREVMQLSGIKSQSSRKFSDNKTTTITVMAVDSSAQNRKRLSDYLTRPYNLYRSIL